MKFIILFISLLLFCVIFARKINNNVDKVRDQCNINQELKEEIKSYSSVANKIIREIVSGKFKGTTYNRLATFVDKFGPRFTGTKNLEDAIDYMISESEKNNLDNVHYENVTVPHWVRGNEFATLIEPREQKLHILGLGYSVGTPQEGIKYEAIVVKDFDELKEKADLVKNKIVVYDQKYVSYGKTVIYRSRGASEASKYGAVAALINSITPYSINTPHTGMQAYEQNITKIPVACISHEDANLLRRIQNRGQKIIIHLKMDAQNLEPKISRNTIADIRGTTYPEKIVLVSGHLDSWDVGQGAMDDAGGALLSWNSLVVLKSLDLKPRRTLRAVLWTAEEMGIIGADAYLEKHKHELQNYIFVMESDIGTFKPVGLAVSGTKETVCIIREILNLLSSINATVLQEPQEGPDIGGFVDLGVPGGSLVTENQDYFVYHHSEGDTMDVEDPVSLDLCTALWAVVSYVVADLSLDLPKIL